jgi:hypothetical protein
VRLQECPFCSTTEQEGSTSPRQCVADIGCEGKVRIFLSISVSVYLSVHLSINTCARSLHNSIKTHWPTLLRHRRERESVCSCREARGTISTVFSLVYPEKLSFSFFLSPWKESIIPRSTHRFSPVLYVSSRALVGGRGSPSVNQARSRLVLATATALRATVSLMNAKYLCIWVYNDIFMWIRIYFYICILFGIVLDHVCRNECKGVYIHCRRSSRMHERASERESMLSFHLQTHTKCFLCLHSFHSTRGIVLD